jgi:arginyl-tRNA synthetase
MGHDVLRLNHVGDWGTQFGMLITLFEQMEQSKVRREGREKKGDEKVGEGVGVGTCVSSDEGTEGKHRFASPRPGDPLKDLNASSIGDLYRSAKQRFDENEAFRDASRLAVVRLQGGEDMECVALWERLCSMSRGEFNGIYEVLGVDIEERGESFYNALLDETIDGVEAAGVAALSRGAMCAFPPDGKAGEEETPPPLILRKGDGGYTYAATDVTALRHRIDVEKATRLVYVTDQGQKRHFEQVFWTAREAGIVPHEVTLEHVPFGLVLRNDGKKLQTRSGENIPLVDMLDEATKRARARLVETTAKRGVEETEAYLDSSAAIIGIGAAKYNDLSRRCTDDYKLSYDTMLALTGNTSSYIQYSCVRATSIIRRAKEGKEGKEGEEGEESKEWNTVHLTPATKTPATKAPGRTSEGAPLTPLTATTSTTSTITPATITAVDVDTCMSPIRLLEAEEIALGRELVRFHDAIDDTANELSPQRLCSFAYDVSQAFNRFYEACPIMTCESLDVKASRIALCSLTGRTLTQTMGLLGIGVVERM